MQELKCYGRASESPAVSSTYRQWRRSILHHLRSRFLSPPPRMWCVLAHVRTSACTCASSHEYARVCMPPEVSPGHHALGSIQLFVCFLRIIHFGQKARAGRPLLRWPRPIPTSTPSRDCWSASRAQSYSIPPCSVSTGKLWGIREECP